MTEEGQWCEGCGITLQTKDENKPGFVPPQATDREPLLCRRCFRLRHYNEIAPVEQDPGTVLGMLEEISHSKALVVQLVDLFDIAGSWIPGIHRHIGENPLLILGNKVDLFPKSTKQQRIKEWVYRLAKEQGIKPVDVILTSAVKGIGLEEVRQGIETHRRGQDVYIVGTANAGKSTFINRLLGEYGEGGGAITTSPYPGTTLDAIRIPLEDGRQLVDMPGVVRKDRLSEWIAPSELQAITPQGEVKPRVYQLNSQQTLFFGGVARFDFLHGERQPFVTYLANNLYIHRSKQEKAEEFWGKHRGGLLVPPEDPATVPPLVRHAFHWQGEEKIDLVISGLGWIRTGNKKGQADIWAPKGVRVEQRLAII